MWNPWYLATVLFSEWCLKYLFDGKIYGEKNIPSSGAFIVAPNHLSHLDPPFIGAAFAQREMLFLARKTLFKPGFWNFILSRINIIPVNKENAADISAIKKAIFFLKHGMGITIFPEGTRSLDGNFGQAQPGLGFLACKTRVPIIPVRIFGSFQILKKNTLFPDVTQSARIVIGQPITFEEYSLFDGKDKYLSVSQQVLERIKALSFPK